MWILTIVRAAMNFLALIIGIFWFRISDQWVIINDLEESTRWAVDLAFNAFVLIAVFELIVRRVSDKSEYKVSIQTRDMRNEHYLKDITQTLRIDCALVLKNKKKRAKTNNKLIINFSNSIVFQLDTRDPRESVEIDNQNLKVTIHLDKVFNHQLIKDEETHTIVFKLMAQDFNNIARIQSSLKKGKLFSNFSLTKKDFKLDIGGEG